MWTQHVFLNIFGFKLLRYSMDIKIMYDPWSYISYGTHGISALKSRCGKEQKADLTGASKTGNSVVLKLITL